VTLSSQTEKIPLNENFVDLIMSNFVAGALYAHLVHQHFPDLKFSREYLEGSLLAQLLQENLQTSDYQATSDWINPNADIRNMLLAPGQGGPYQLNDYSKRLEDNVGMINFAVLQKTLGYKIQDQDRGIQTGKKGPDSLDNKYFGPIAAAYFQYNDLLRLKKINEDSWGPSYPYFAKCMKNLENLPEPGNFLDMILNATYNAGPWSDINKTYIELCATLSDRKDHINDYNLADADYQKAIGTKEAAGSTFILYPRQIRFYLDELYNNLTTLKTNNHLLLPITQLRTVFARAMGTLAYLSKKSGQYQFINTEDANAAFDSAVASTKISPQASLDMGKPAEKNQLLTLLETAIANLAKAQNIDFTEITEKDWG
jgi:hypothetical protein